MKDINLTDSCQAHLPVQYASNIEFIHKKCTGFMIDSESHLSGMCITSFLFVPLAVRVHTGCSAFPFSYPSVLTYVLGAQKNRLIETVLLSTHNI